MFPKIKSCIEDNNLEGFRRLFQSMQQAHINSHEDENGGTLLHIASHLGRVVIVEELLSHGASPNVEDNDSWTPLLAAAKEGHFEVCAILLRNGATVDVTDLGGWTPLLWACYKRRTAVVELLLRSGANTQSSGHHNAPPLIWVAGRGYTDVAKLLLAHGAKVNRPDKHGNTPIIWAARKGYLSLVQLLLDEGASVDVVGMKSWTAILVAVQGNYIEVVRKLLDKKPSLYVMDKDGHTPLAIACREGFSEICQMLLDAGATVNGQDRYGDTVLIHAAKNGHRQIVEKLLKKYADVDAQGRNGETALHWAVLKGHNSTVKLLLAKNPNVDAVSDESNTPLLCAAKTPNAEAFQMLLEKKAKVATVDKAGDTALHIAMRKHDKTIAEMILKDMKNSKLLYRPNKAGETPYNIDHSKEKPILVQLSGSRRLFSSQDSENSLGYDLYSSALADILIDPMTVLPLTIGLFAKWGSGKSFLINKLKEELQNFGNDFVDQTYKVSITFVLFLINMAVVLGLVVGTAVHDWVPGVITASVLFIVTMACVFAFSYRSNRNRSYYDDTSRIDFIYSWTNRLILLMKVIFCIAPDPQGDSKDAKPLQFVFADRARVSNGSSGVSILIIITSLFEKVEAKYGEVATRMCRGFRSRVCNRQPDCKFRRACCVPTLLIFVILVDITLIGVGLLANYLEDIMAPSQSKHVDDLMAIKAAMIGCGIIFAVSLIASANNIYRALLALAMSPRSRLKRQIKQFANLGSDGQQQLHRLKEDVKELVETVRTLDSFCGRTTRLTIALDGLDTYKQEQVVSMLDGVSQLFSDPQSPFVVILAIDPHLVSKTIDSNAGCMPRESPMTGNSYLRSLVQLPFYLQNAGLRKVKISQQASLAARGIIDDVKTASKKAAADQGGTTGMRRNRSSAANLNRKVYHTDSGISDHLRTRNLSDSMESGIAMMGHQGDVTKVLLADGYFSDVDPKSLRRLMNLVAVSGRLMKAFNVDFNWLHLSAWTNLTEQWPYRMSWVISYVEEREKYLDDSLSLRSLYERVKDSIPSKNSADSFIDVDKDPVKLEALLASSRNALQLVHLKIFIPFTNNLDPYLCKYIKDTLKDPTHPTALSPNEMGIGDPTMQCTCLAVRGTACLHPPIPDVLLRQPLAHMSTETLCEGFQLVEGLRASNVQQVADLLKTNNICGRVLLLCNLADLKPALKMNFGDWELFQSLVLAIRNREYALPSRAMEGHVPIHRPVTRHDSSGTYEKQLNLEEQSIHGALQVLNEEAMEDVFDKANEDDDMSSVQGHDSAENPDETEVLFLQTNQVASGSAALVDIKSSNLSLFTPSNSARSRTVTEVIWQDSGHQSLSRAASQRSVIDSGSISVGPASILRKGKGWNNEASSPRRPGSQEGPPIRSDVSPLPQEEDENEPEFSTNQERQPLVASAIKPHPQASDFSHSHERKKSMKGEKKST